MSKYRQLRILISGGGTGGHIFPAISIADEMRRLNPDSEILFVGAEGKMEMEKVPAAGYRIVGLPVVGLQRQLNLKNIINDLKLIFKPHFFKCKIALNMSELILKHYRCFTTYGFKITAKIF